MPFGDPASVPKYKDLRNSTYYCQQCPKPSGSNATRLKASYQNGRIANYVCPDCDGMYPVVKEGKPGHSDGGPDYDRPMPGGQYKLPKSMQHVDPNHPALARRRARGRKV